MRTQAGLLVGPALDHAVSDPATAPRRAESLWLRRAGHPTL